MCCQLFRDKKRIWLYQIFVIVNFLKKSGCPKNLIISTHNFFKNRKIIYNMEKSRIQLYLKSGCPQGSPLGPLIWNITISDLLNSKFPSDVYIQASADDITLVIRGNSRHNIEQKATEALKIVENWGIDKELTFNTTKSKFTVIGDKYIKRPPIIKLGNKNLKFCKEIKILGVYIDNKLSFIPIINYVKEKVNQIINSQGKFTAYNWGLPSKHLQQIYVRAIERIIVYAAPIWYKKQVLIKKS